jgi:transposase
MNLRSIIPATIGRKPASDDRIRTRWRRRMRAQLASKRSRRRCGYTQRWQAETANSMMKRNLGSALRGKTNASRMSDLRVKVLTHNLMILR